MDGVEVEQPFDKDHPSVTDDGSNKNDMEVEPVEKEGSNNNINSSSQATTTAETAEDVENNNNNSNNNCNTSALQDNIARKGQNAYYFAHAHKATGPAWDGKPEPRLLSRYESSDDGIGSGSSVVEGHRKPHSFDYAKSNITSYAFLDGVKNVKLYIDLEGVGEKCSEDDICLDFTESSFSLVITNYTSPNPASSTASSSSTTTTPLCLSFGKLTANITNASYKKKKDRIIVTLTKAAEGEWETINDKGSPDHEVV